MTVGEMLKIFKQYNIHNDAVLMSDSGWECWATDMDGIYYNKTTNTVVFTPEFSDCDHYYYDQDWVACKKEGNEDVIL